MPTTYERERSVRIQNAQAVVIGLFTRYSITPRSAKPEIRERFSQEDLDTYKAAMAVLDGEGAIN